MAKSEDPRAFFREADRALGDVLGVVSVFNVPDTHHRRMLRPEEIQDLELWVAQLRASVRKAVGVATSPSAPDSVRRCAGFLSEDLRAVVKAVGAVGSSPPAGESDRGACTAETRVGNALGQLRFHLDQIQTNAIRMREDLLTAATEVAPNGEPAFLRFEHLAANLSLLVKSYLRNLISQVAPLHEASWPCVSSFSAKGYLTTPNTATLVLEPRPAGLPAMGPMRLLPFTGTLDGVGDPASNEGHERLRREMGVSGRGVVMQIPLRVETEQVDALMNAWTDGDREWVAQQVRLNVAHQARALRPTATEEEDAAEPPQIQIPAEAEDVTEPEQTPIPDLDTVEPPERKDMEYEFAEIKGESAGIRRVLWRLESAVRSLSPVVICGETGTGKELVAKALHWESPRRNGPFVPLNCSAVPETMIESELFGHVKGAFSGAMANRAGVFRAAIGGTVFLDEIGEMSPAMQAKVLRVVEEHEVCPLGTEACELVDVRIIVATNRDLAELVRDRKFREDLLHRLRVHTIQVPPLRERLEDLPLLVRHFADRCGAGCDLYC